MIKQTDIAGRLRLLRYGIIVVVIFTFVITLVLPYSRARIPGADVSITDFLGPALQAALIAAVIGIVVYVGYHYLLTKKLPFVGGRSAESENKS